MDANRTPREYELTDELARFCLSPANRDASRKLAWVNSICILFLLIGVFGARQPVISLSRPSPLAEAPITVAVEPPPPPPEQAPEKLQPTTEEKPQAPQVVAVTLDSPAVNFSVPTVGNLVVPNGVAATPPLNPMRPITSPVEGRATVLQTGEGGDRPAPPYPKIAIEEGQEGSVPLLITLDANGHIASVEFMGSSGHPLLDQTAKEFVKKNWIMPRNGTNQQYETVINFRLKKRSQH